MEYKIVPGQNLFNNVWYGEASDWDITTLQDHDTDQFVFKLTFNYISNFKRSDTSDAICNFEMGDKPEKEASFSGLSPISKLPPVVGEEKTHEILKNEKKKEEEEEQIPKVENSETDEKKDGGENDEEVEDEEKDAVEDEITENEKEKGKTTKEVENEKKEEEKKMERTIRR